MRRARADGVKVGRIGPADPPPATDKFKIETGYRARVHFDAVSQYFVSQVPTGLALPPTGVYLATVEHLRSSLPPMAPT